MINKDRPISIIGIDKKNFSAIQCQLGVYENVHQSN
jgi:hypothetical protein